MKKKFLSLLAATLFVAGAVQAQTILDEAVIRIPFNEQTTDAPSMEIVKNKKLHRNAEEPIAEAINDSEMGWVRRFEGGQNAMTYSQPLPVGGKDERTYSWWFNLDTNTIDSQGKESLQQNCQMMFTAAPGSNMTDKNSLMFMLMARNKIRIAVSGAPTNKIDFMGDGKNLLGSWHHVAVVISEGAKASEVKCYIDGVDYGTAHTVTPKGEPVKDFVCYTQRAFLRIGHSISGSLSEIAIFAKALTQEEVQEVMKLTNR